MANNFLISQPAAESLLQICHFSQCVVSFSYPSAAIVMSRLHATTLPAFLQAPPTPGQQCVFFLFVCFFLDQVICVLVHICRPVLIYLFWTVLKVWTEVDPGALTYALTMTLYMVEVFRRSHSSLVDSSSLT